MMNNTSCATFNFTDSSKSTEHFVVYSLLTPFYFTFGLSGHILLLLAVYRQSKLERVYFYQVIRAVAEATEIITRTLLCVHNSYWNSQLHHQIPPMFAKCYVCIWFAARLLTVLANTVITMTLLLSVCTVADRVFALARPVVYRSINRRVHEMSAVISSIVISVLLSGADYHRFEITVEDDRRYSYRINQVYISDNTVYGLSLLRVSAQAVLLIILIGLSISLLILYHRKFVLKLPSGPASENGVQANQSRQKSEKALAMLTLLECAFSAMQLGILMSSLLMIYVFPSVYLCTKDTIVPLFDSALMAVDMADFYTAILVSASFRRMVGRVICRRGAHGVSVAPIDAS